MKLIRVVSTLTILGVAGLANLCQAPADVYHALLGGQLEGWAAVAGVAVPNGTNLRENVVTVDGKQFQVQRLAGLDCHKTQWTPEV
jgi:hypothetical protein